MGNRRKGVRPVKDRIFESEASLNAGMRLATHGMNVFDAFESLGLGWTREDLISYMRKPIDSQLGTMSTVEQGRVVGMVAAAMIVAVEQERALKRAN